MPYKAAEHCPNPQYHVESVAGSISSSSRGPLFSFLLSLLVFKVECEKVELSDPSVGLHQWNLEVPAKPWKVLHS